MHKSKKNRLANGFHSYVFPLPGWVKTMAQLFQRRMSPFSVGAGVFEQPGFYSEEKWGDYPY
jgi:hypothetical protein